MWKVGESLYLYAPSPEASSRGQAGHIDTGRTAYSQMHDWWGSCLLQEDNQCKKEPSFAEMLEIVRNNETDKKIIGEQNKANVTKAGGFAGRQKKKRMDGDKDALRCYACGSAAHKGLFIYHVSQIWPLLDPHPPYVSQYEHFGDPPSPSLYSQILHLHLHILWLLSMQ